MFDSEPVAGSVSTAPIGVASVTWCLPVRMSQPSPSYFAAAATYFEPSITEPPPTAIMNSTFSSLTIATALSNVSLVGFASTPENSIQA